MRLCAHVIISRFARTALGRNIRPKSSAQSRRGTVKLAPLLNSPCWLRASHRSSAYLLPYFPTLQIKKYYVSYRLCVGLRRALTIDVLLGKIPSCELKLTR
ncbi:hypothetical protein EDB89DRAFT_379992 [Lactarius sanguifluus]|nr:hypothetical protein EDB89DRAFT_379992 [Lactarius sanguifluus]